jgi:hypothetical protein
MFSSTGQCSERSRVPFPGHQGRQYPTPTHPEQIRDDTGQLDVGILEDSVHPVLGLTPGLDESYAGACQITQGLDRGWREETRPDEPMGQELGDSPRIGFVRLMTRPSPHLLRVAHQHLERPVQYVIHRLPIAPRTLHGDHRTVLLDKPFGQG